MRRFARFLLWAALTFTGLCLALTTVYFVRGSLELFPTAEQTAKIRVVTGAIFLALLAIGALIALNLRSLPPTKP